MHTKTLHDQDQAAVAAPASPPVAGGLRQLRSDVNFRWIFASGAISLLGDQFTLLALPWLVLQLTHDGLALGSALAAMGLPRALCVLFGGTLVDRHSPLHILATAKALNAVLLGVLAALTAFGPPPLTLVYGLCFGIGVVGALSMPAGAALLPRVIDTANLKAANAIIMGTAQAAALLGPLFAGVTITQLGRPTAPASGENAGLAVAFALDAASFLISSVILLRVRAGAASHVTPADNTLVPQNARDVLALLWRDRDLCTCCLYWLAVALVCTGPLQVALPTLVKSRMPGGAGALGLVMAANSAGALAGMLFSMLQGKRFSRHFGRALLCIDALVGVLLLMLGHADRIWQGALILLLVGFLYGYVQVATFSWVQQRIPTAILGRAISIFMFLSMGSAPLSVLGTGALLRVLTLDQLFAGAGALLTVMVTLCAMFSSMPVIAAGTLLTNNLGPASAPTGHQLAAPSPQESLNT